MKRTNKKGFTIVELVIVIAVIAILAAVLIPNISRLVKKANESSDIQAVRNMNTFLAAEGATGDIKSILDVYDLFVDSGYNVDSYSPLYSGRHFYYDKQYNQILYVETESGKVLFPEERKNDTMASLEKANHDLFSLSMEVPTPKEPTDYKPNESTGVTATVTNASEFAYVVNEYNKMSNKNLTLTIDGTIDMRGAQCLIETAKGDITISGTGTIKNITANKFISTSDQNSQKSPAQDGCAVLIGETVGHKVTIEGITIENANIKNIEAGNVGFLIGMAASRSENGKEITGSEVTIKNVTIKNSTVIGHRNVGALVGYASGSKTKITLQGTSVLENVNVKTAGGRSALVIGYICSSTVTVESGAKVDIDSNSKLSIYRNDSSKQRFADGAPKDCPADFANAGADWDNRYIIDDQDQFICSDKFDNNHSMTVYGFKAGALILREYNTVATTANGKTTKVHYAKALPIETIN